MNQFLRLFVCLLIFVVVLSLSVLLHFSESGGIIYGKSLQGWLLVGSLFGAFAAAAFYFDPR